MTYRIAKLYQYVLVLCIYILCIYIASQSVGVSNLDEPRQAEADVGS